VAVGAMLAMIERTMFPAAFRKDAEIVGLAALMVVWSVGLHLRAHSPTRAAPLIDYHARAVPPHNPSAVPRGPGHLALYWSSAG
jgi:hypothetical protein